MGRWVGGGGGGGGGNISLEGRLKEKFLWGQLRLWQFLYWLFSYSSIWIDSKLVCMDSLYYTNTFQFPLLITSSVSANSLVYFTL